MKKYYECHITMEGNPKMLKALVEQFKWKFSRIDGDIKLGDGVKCYATMHYSYARYTEADVINYVKIYACVFREFGAKIVRRKVEVVVYDSRSEVLR